VRQVRQRLDVVDHRRLGVQTLDRRERRLDARHPALTFERLEQRGLFAADVRAGAAVNDDVEVEARALDVLPEEALGACVGDRLHHPVVAERELAADVEEREVALDRVRRDRDALDELVRVAFEEHAIFERRRFTLVAVDDEVPREDAGRQERPLLTAGEVGTTATAQPRRRDLCLHRGRVTLGQRLREGLVRAARERAVDRERVVGPIVQAPRDDARLLYL
jgi:hypothetical protein